MKKKNIFILAAMLSMSIYGTALAASSSNFGDVPTNHWAYQAINELEKDGVINGYDDKSFQGNKTMTRYEMAQIVEKAIDNSSKANAKQKLLIDKLASEFALEINNIDTRVTKVEQFNQSTLKVGVDTLMTYVVDNPPDGKPKVKGDEAFMSRMRLYFSGDLNDKTKFLARVGTSYGLAGMSSSTTVPSATSNTNMFADIAQLTISDVFGMNYVRLGRQGFNELGGNVIQRSGGNDGISLEKKMSNNTTMRVAAMVTKVNNTAATAYDAQEIQFISLNSKTNDGKFGVSGMYLNNNTTVASTATTVGYTGTKLGGISAYKKLGNWTLLGEYDKVNLEGASANAESNPHAYLVQLTTGKAAPTTMFLNPQTMCNIFKPGDDAFTIAYHYLGAGVIPGSFSSWKNATATSLTNSASFTDNVKGWAIDYQYTLMKGLAIDFTYQQLKYANTVGTAIAGNKVDDCFAIALQGRF